MKITFLFFITITMMFSNTNLQKQEIEIMDVNNTSAKILLPNLHIGQSGIIIKKTNNHSIILTQAVITESNTLNSTIMFIQKQVLPQDAIPTSKLKPKNKDKFILNHLYNTSLLLVPNGETKEVVKNLYPNQNFLNEDFFAAHLKLIKTPIPKKNTISDFAQTQQIGTIFVVIKNKLYILDSVTFKIIDTIIIKNVKSDSVEVPFFTKIKDIEQSLWDFGDKKIKDYNTYYSKLLEIK